MIQQVNGAHEAVKLYQFVRLPRMTKSALRGIFSMLGKASAQKGFVSDHLSVCPPHRLKSAGRLAQGIFIY